MSILDIFRDLFGKSRTVVHITRHSGESLKAQQLLREAGIKFEKEIEGMASSQLQVNTGHVSPMIKIKVNSSESSYAREVLKSI